MGWIGNVVARTLTRKAVGKVMKAAGSLDGKKKAGGRKKKGSAKKGKNSSREAT